MKTLRVIARGDGTVPYVDEAGRPHAGRAYGRSADGTPVAEVVPDTHYVRRAMGRGHLALAPEPEAPPPVAEAPAPEPAIVTTDASLVIQRGIAADPRIHHEES